MQRIEAKQSRESEIPLFVEGEHSNGRICATDPFVKFLKSSHGPADYKVTESSDGCFTGR